MLLRCNGGNKNNATTLAISGNGATIVRWQVGENNIFYPKQFTKNRAGELKDRGGCFIGAPVFGCPEEAFAIGLPQHGTVRQSLPHHSSLGKVSENHASFTFQTPGSYSDLDGYPFEWWLQVDEVVYENGFDHAMQVMRKPSAIVAATKPMYFNAGIHPYFPAPGAVRIGDRVIQFGDMVETEKVEVPDDGIIRVELDFGEVTMTMKGYKWLNLWSDHGDKFFCVEPLWDHPRRWGTEEGLYLQENQPMELACSFMCSE